MKMFIATTLVSLLAVSCTSAAPQASVQDNSVDKINDSDSFTRAARYLGACLENEDLATCLAVKGIIALNRAARSNNIDLLDGVSFKRDAASPVQRSSKALSENDVYSQLPANADERNDRIVDLAISSVTDFVGTHNLEVKFPAEAKQEIARALDEGRGKLKKMMGPLALAIGAKLFAIIPIVLGGLALLTAKAVIVAKIALFLALIVGGSRLFGGFGNKFGGAIGGGYNSNGWSSGNTAGWTSGASSAYPYARSLSDAHELAYAGHAQDQH